MPTDDREVSEVMKTRSSAKSTGSQSRSSSRQSTKESPEKRSGRKSRGRRSVSGQGGKEFDEDSLAGMLADPTAYLQSMEVQIEFLYSAEVEVAIRRLRERKQKKKKFKRNEIHIFHLPKIVDSGTLPFRPSASFLRASLDPQLPKPKDLPKLPRIKKRQRSFLLDQTLAEVKEEKERVRRPTPLSRSLPKVLTRTPRTTPK